MLEDRLGGDVHALAQTADLVVQAARQRPELGTVLSTFRPDVPQYKVDMDLAKVQTLGVPSATPITRYRLFSAAFT